MGTSAAVAMNRGQITLVKSSLRGIAQARAMSEPTIANMRQKLGFEFFYNPLD
jgi:Cu+-exporting ATPase